MTKDEAISKAQQDYERGFIDGMQKQMQSSVDRAVNAMAEQPAQQEPVDSTQISKVWWDGEKLMAKPIPFVEFYKPAQRTWVGLTDEEIHDTEGYEETREMYRFARAILAKSKEKNT